MTSPYSVNKNASDKDKKATEDFIKWMVSDEDAKKILSRIWASPFRSPPLTPRISSLTT